MQAIKHQRLWVMSLAAIGGIALLTTVSGCTDRGCDSKYYLEVRFENYDTQAVHLFRPETEIASVRRLEAGTFDTVTYESRFFEPVSGLGATPGLGDQAVQRDCDNRIAAARATPAVWTFNAVREGVVIGTASVQVTYDQTQASPTQSVTVSWDGAALTAVIN